MVPCKIESPDEIRRIQREMNNIIATLKSYNPSSDICNSTEIQNLEEFNKFLTNKFRALKSAANIINGFSLNAQQEKHNSQRRNQNFHTTVGSNYGQLCKENHPLSQ